MGNLSCRPLPCRPPGCAAGSPDLPRGEVRRGGLQIWFQAPGSDAFPAVSHKYAAPAKYAGAMSIRARSVVPDQGWDTGRCWETVLG